MPHVLIHVTDDNGRHQLLAFEDLNLEVRPLRLNPDIYASMYGDYPEQTGITITGTDPVHAVIDTATLDEGVVRLIGHLTKRAQDAEEDAIRAHRKLAAAEARIRSVTDILGITEPEADEEADDE